LAARAVLSADAGLLVNNKKYSPLTLAPGLKNSPGNPILTEDLSENMISAFVRFGKINQL